MQGVLSGVRVLDFGRYIAGPFCAALLGDMGADVIRIERREGSEDRYVQPVDPDADGPQGGEGTMFVQMNRNKKGLTLDPMSEGGREVVRRLIATADVVVANLPPKTLQAMGLSFDQINAINERTILTTVSAFGHKGPYRDRVGFDGIAQVMVGAAHLTGHPDEPMKSYAPWVDFGTASLAAFGTMAALLARNETSRGQIVEGALLQTALSFFNFHLIEQQLAKTDREAIGNRSPYAGPADIVRTKDGWILVQVIGRPLFKRWVKLVGEEGWLDDPRFRNDLDRGRHGALLSERTQQWSAELSTKEALEALAEARIPAGPVMTPQQILDDPHVAASGFLEPHPYPGFPGEPLIATTPVTLSDTPGTIRRRAPVLGEHTDEILTEIGYSSEEIAALRTDGAI